MSGPDFGSYLSDSALADLQRRFGLAITPRARVPDPLVNLPLMATRNCPCDSCPEAATCRAECRRFGRWVENGPTGHSSRGRRRSRKGR